MPSFHEFSSDRSEGDVEHLRVRDRQQNDHGASMDELLHGAEWARKGINADFDPRPVEGTVTPEEQNPPP